MRLVRGIQFTVGQSLAETVEPRQDGWWVCIVEGHAWDVRIHEFAIAKALAREAAKREKA